MEQISTSTLLPNAISFFDDEDPTIKFDFLSSTSQPLPSELQSPPLVYNFFKVKNYSNTVNTQGWYCLYNGYIANFNKVT